MLVISSQSTITILSSQIFLSMNILVDHVIGQFMLNKCATCEGPMLPRFNSST